MGRFSPTVTPHTPRRPGFEEIGASIAEAISTIRERHRQKKSDDRAERRDKRDEKAAERDAVQDEVRLYNDGYRRGEPPADEQNPDAQAIGRQRGNQIQDGPGAAATPPPPQPGNQTQGMAGPGATAQAGGPAVVQQPAHSPIRQAGMQFYTLPSGQGYIDPSGTPEGRAEARDERTFKRQGERDDRIDSRQRERDDRLDSRADARDAATAGREDARDDRRYRREVGMEGSRHRHELELEEVRSGVGNPIHPKNLDRSHEMVSTQINDTEQALTREGTALGKGFEESGVAGDSTGYKAISSELDRLRGNRGRISAARGGDAQAARGIRREAGGSQYQLEITKLEGKRQRALNMGIPAEKVDAAFAQEAAALSARFEQEYGQ